MMKLLIIISGATYQLNPGSIGEVIERKMIRSIVDPKGRSCVYQKGVKYRQLSGKRGEYVGRSK